MFRLAFTLTAHLHYLLQRYGPSNILLAKIRARHGLKWGGPAMLLAAPYLGVAYLCTTWIDNDGPDWLHLIVLVTIWNTIKFLTIGPLSLLLLAHARFTERRRKSGNPVGHSRPLSGL